MIDMRRPRMIANQRCILTQTYLCASILLAVDLVTVAPPHSDLEVEEDSAAATPVLEVRALDSEEPPTMLLEEPAITLVGSARLVGLQQEVEEDSEHRVASLPLALQLDKVVASLDKVKPTLALVPTRPTPALAPARPTSTPTSLRSPASAKIADFTTQCTPIHVFLFSFFVF